MMIKYAIALAVLLAVAAFLSWAFLPARLVTVTVPGHAPVTYDAIMVSQGGQWKGRVRIADDFDDLPDDIATAFGIEQP